MRTDGSIAQRLVRLAYPYGSVRRVLRGPVSGNRYVVSPGMGATYAFGKGCYLAEAGSRVKPGTTVYDIGANVGQMTLAFSRWTGPTGKVIAIEPAPEPFRTLERNARLAPHGNVVLVKAALGDTDGPGTLLFSHTSPTNGHLAGTERLHEQNPGWPVAIQVTRLDTLVATGYPPPDFLKVDVEGAAAALFRGAMDTLTRCRPLIYIEFHGPDEWAAGRDLVRALGYDCHQLDGTPVPDPTKPHKALPFWLTPR